MSAVPGRRTRLLAIADGRGAGRRPRGSALAGPLPPRPAGAGGAGRAAAGIGGDTGLERAGLDAAARPRRPVGDARQRRRRPVRRRRRSPRTAASSSSSRTSAPTRGNQVAVRDRRERTTTVLDGPDSNGPLQHPTISGDGRWIAYTRSIDGPRTRPRSSSSSGRAAARSSLPRTPAAVLLPRPAGAQRRRAGSSPSGRRARRTTEVLVLDRAAGAWEPISVDVNNRPIGARTGDAGAAGGLGRRPARRLHGRLRAASSSWRA